MKKIIINERYPESLFLPPVPFTHRVAPEKTGKATGTDKGGSTVKKVVPAKNAEKISDKKAGSK